MPEQPKTAATLAVPMTELKSELVPEADSKLAEGERAAVCGQLSAVAVEKSLFLHSHSQSSMSYLGAHDMLKNRMFELLLS